jgi:AraC-like DNA-binding protein
VDSILKTSFNRNFKKITGMSPSQYAKKLKIDAPSEDEQ